MELLILDTEFTTLSIIDVYKSLIWTDRYNEYGDFELYIPMESRLLDIIKHDFYAWNNDSEHTMIIEKLQIDSDIENGNYLIATGRSLESILERRVITSQVIISGNFQTAIKQLINDNIISPSVTDRKIPNFIFKESTDTKVTSIEIEETQYIGTDLYSIIKSQCQEHDIGFKLVLTDDNKFEFSLYAGTDRSYDQTDNPYVIFSPNFENIINSNYLSSKQEYKNVVFVGGEGEGAEKTIVSVGSASGLNRREMFEEANDISKTTETGTISDSEYKSQLKSKGEEVLKDNDVLTAFEGEVEATNLFVYGTDFFLGDIVQVSDEYGNEGKAYISELVFSRDESEQSIYPTFKAINEDDEKGE